MAMDLGDAPVEAIVSATGLWARAVGMICENDRHATNASH